MPYSLVVVKLLLVYDVFENGCECVCVRVWEVILIHSPATARDNKLTEIAGQILIQAKHKFPIYPFSVIVVAVFVLVAGVQS